MLIRPEEARGHPSQAATRVSSIPILSHTPGMTMAVPAANLSTVRGRDVFSRALRRHLPRRGNSAGFCCKLPPMSPRRGSYSLAEWPHDVVRLVCNQCGRRGQYRKATLLTQYPADTAMPDL